MSDIVMRLREGVGLPDEITESEHVMDQAAVEIERLRAERDAANQQAMRFADDVWKLRAQRDALLAALKIAQRYYHDPETIRQIDAAVKAAEGG